MDRLAACAAAALLASGAALGANDECVALSARPAHIRVTSAVPQNDLQKATVQYIRTNVVNTAPNVGAGGIFGAIIGAAIADAIINNQIKKRIEEASLALPTVLEASKGFDFRDEFWNRLDPAVRTPGKMNVLDVTLYKEERAYLEPRDDVDGKAVDGILDLSTQYSLTSDLRSFVMTTLALLQSKQDGKEWYRCKYVFTSPPIVAGNTTVQAAASAWAANDAAAYKAAALIGMEATLKMLRYDLLDEDAPRPGGAEVKVLQVIQAGSTSLIGGIPVKLIAREGNLVIGRDKRFVRAAIDAQTFAPPAEIAAAAPRKEAPMRPTTVDDLQGLLPQDEAAPPAEAPKEAKAEAPKEAKAEARAEPKAESKSPPKAAAAPAGELRKVGADDLQDLMPSQ